MKGKETVTSVINRLESEVRTRLAPDLKAAGFDSDFPEQLILLAFKEERRLEVYARLRNESKLLKSYLFTAFSGQLGPKIQEGDKQIPEGIYKVEYLNPNSAFYLSIKVSYPNDFDKSKSVFTDVTDMGGDIFIHGKAATVGCIPIGDEAIEEVFLLVQKAIQNEVNIIIAPRDFRANPTYPKVEGIDWEVELYNSLNQELKKLK